MNCDIIRDLMPGCIDGVISEAGNSAVRAHLESCGECRRIFAEMKEDITESTPEERTALDGFKKIRTHTRYLKAGAALWGVLLAAVITGVFLKVYVVGSLLEVHTVQITDCRYDEQADSLAIDGYMDIVPGHISSVKWKENPSIGDRVDLFVCAAETLPFGQEKRDFSITIPNMKGKVVYLVSPDYDQIKVYDWQGDHRELLSGLEQEIYGRVDLGWNEEKVMLSPVQGIRTIDGTDGIVYFAFFLVSDDAWYRRMGDAFVTYGDMKEADYYIWISLEKPHQIRVYDLVTGTYREID